MTTPETNGSPWDTNQIIAGLFDRIRALGGVGNGIVYPETFGAKRDGVNDDSPAINAAIAKASELGGAVAFSPGTYGLGGYIGSQSGFGGVKLFGAGDMATTLKALTDTRIIGGSWTHSTIENIKLDSNLKGSPCVSAHFDKVVFRHNMLDGWNNFGMRLNDGEFGDLGLLNYISRNHIVQRSGTGIWTSYRFIDSWIDFNNIGSTGPNVSLEGGPVRVLANHLNGAPLHNLELRGNKRVTVADNIMEGSGEEAIIYNMPPWLTEDAAQIQITNNAISNGGKNAAGAKPAIGIYGVGEAALVSGFSVVGNIVSAEDGGSGWSYAVLARHANKIAVSANQWGSGLTGGIAKTSSSTVAAAGNTSDTIASVA